MTFTYASFTFTILLVLIGSNVSKKWIFCVIPCLLDILDCSLGIVHVRKNDQRLYFLKRPEKDDRHNLPCLVSAHVFTERDVAQWLESGALSMSLPVVRFLTMLGTGFSEKCHVSPLSILGHCFDVVSWDKTHQKNISMAYIHIIYS